MEEKKKNYVNLRVRFKDSIKEANPAAPTGTMGMRFSMDAKHDPATPQGTFGSNLVVRTVDNALATMPLLLSRDNITLGEFLEAALDKNLDGFLFRQQWPRFHGKHLS